MLLLTKPLTFKTKVGSKIKKSQIELGTDRRSKYWDQDLKFLKSAQLWSQKLKNMENLISWKKQKKCIDM